jgi:putative tricarboxylic transport membrane protein
MIGVWIRILKTPQYILIPLVVVLGLIGSYSLNNNMIDVWTMFFMGLIGYGLRKLDLSLASFLIGFVLGPMIEKYFVQSIFIGLGDPMYFVSTPIAAGMWFAVIVVMVGGLILNIIRAISKKRASVVFKLED